MSKSYETAKARIARCTTENPVTGCWEWQLALPSHGYAQTKIDGKLWRAHRLSYVTYIGEIPPGLYVCHSCDKPSCVNPAHLFLGTPAENSRDASQKGRMARYEMSGPGKLTEDDVAEIILRASAGEPYHVIAKDYGVDRTAIWRWGQIHGIRRGRGWKSKGVHKSEIKYEQGEDKCLN